MSDPTELPDGSGFFTGTFPLPKDHWLYAEEDNVPPMLLQCGTANPYRAKIEEAVREGVKYAIRASTMNGQDDDFDPDALVQNAIVGVVGYFTSDGSYAGDNKSEKVSEDVNASQP